MGPKLKDLAKAAGVSVSAASRALNGYPDVSDTTRKRVLAAAQRLGYRPDPAARSLVTKKSQSIGVFVLSQAGPLFSHSFAAEVLDGILDRLAESEYDVVLFGRSRIETAGSFRTLCAQRRVEAAVFMGLRSDDPRLEELGELGVPVVTLDVPLPWANVMCVTCDNAQAARRAIEHLLALGHRRIGLVNGHEAAPVSTARAAGYREALLAAGIPPDGTLERTGDFTVDGGRLAALDLLRLADPPTAIFCASDLMALGALRAAEDLGLSVPGDVSVVGFDDIPAAVESRPPLTTVHQPRYAMGRAAAEAVLQATRGLREQNRSEIVLETYLVRRDSTAKPRAKRDEQARSAARPRSGGA
ncbi:MAG: LacI family DNA-binding transcriptional regulator [Firmicutes bacterium]|nr:LacI family DNA-binding transcriptional regulator [Bacillota bacterium]